MRNSGQLKGDAVNTDLRLFGTFTAMVWLQRNDPFSSFGVDALLSNASRDPAGVLRAVPRLNELAQLLPVQRRTVLLLHRHIRLS